MNSVALDLGFIQVYWYSLMIIMGIIVGAFLAYKEVKRQNINVEVFFNMIFYTVVLGIIGARLYYVLFEFSYYSKNFMEIFQVWEGGLAIHGGIIAGVLVIYFYSKKYKLNTLKMMDICAVSLIIAQSIGRWGNFFNGEAYGPITTATSLATKGIPKFIIDGMYINNNYYEPTFLYESIWNIVGFIILILIRKYYKNLKTGQLTGTYLMWYSLGRFYIEGLRGDSLMLGDIRIAQMISVILFVCGLSIFIYYWSGSLKDKFKKIYKRGIKWIKK